MSNLFIIDGVGLAGLAIIYHNQDTSHPLYELFSPTGSVNKKYLTSEASIMAAFSMVADLNKPDLMVALKRVVKYLFDMTVPYFDIFYKDHVKFFQDYGTFVQAVGSQYAPHILDSAYLAADLYPGAIIVGRETPFYKHHKITVEAV